MTDWAEKKDGTHIHPWCGTVTPVAPGLHGKPVRWTWTDRRGKERGSWNTLAEAKLKARKFSGVEMR